MVIGTSGNLLPYGWKWIRIADGEKIKRYVILFLEADIKRVKISLYELLRIDSFNM